MMEIQRSSKIDAFFKENCEIESFWDALHEQDEMMPDCEVWYQDVTDDFENGFKLASKAIELGKPIFEHSCDDYDENRYFYIGTEKEIIKKLNKGWKAWRKESKTSKKKKAIQREIDRLQAELNSL